MNSLTITVKRLLLPAAIALVLLVRLATALPLDGSIPGGTDTASHLFKSWTFSQGFSWWSHDWYGGFNLFSHYPPLFHLLVASLTGPLSHVFAYKLVIDAVYLVTPLAFLVLLRRLGLDSTKQALGLLVFSLLPVHSYYLYDGRHPALLALLFVTLYASAMLSKGRFAFLTGGFFLGLAILSHHLTAALGLAVTLPLFLQHRRRLAMAVGIALFVASVWLLPFLLDSFYKPAPQTLIGGRALEVAAEVVGAAYLSTLANSWAQPVLAVQLLLLALSVLLVFKDSATRRETLRSNLPALLMLAITAVIYLLVSYKRVLLLATIPAALIIASHQFSHRTRWLPFVLVTLLVIPLTHPLAISPPELPDLGTGGRVLFLGALPGAGYMEAYLLPRAGHPYTLGWHPESQTARKAAFNLALTAPENVSDQQYADLLRRGWISTVLLPSGSPLYARFASSQDFRLLGSKDGLSAFALVPSPSFMEIDGRPVDVNVSFGRDTLGADFNCSTGLLTIKESWSSTARLTIDGQSVPFSENTDGFMAANIGKAGPCHLTISWGWL